MTTLCVLIAVSVISNPLLVSHSPYGYDGGEEAGFIVEINCAALIKKSGSSTEEKLDAKRDKGRKFFAGDALKCEGKGEMKIEVYKRSYTVKYPDPWYPIPVINKRDAIGPNRVGFLRGTYQLDLERTQPATNASQIEVPYAWRSAMNSPSALAIDLNGDIVTIASSVFPKYSFKADGREYRFVTFEGETISTLARFDDDRLVVSSSSDRDKALKAVFSPQNNGELKFTSEISFGEKREPTFFKAMYRKVSPSALFEALAGGAAGNYIPMETRQWARDKRGIATVRRIQASFDGDISTESLTEGSTISLTVSEPGEYRGAKVRARVVGGSTLGAAHLVITFDRIIMPNGETYHLIGDSSAANTVRQTSADDDTGQILGPTTEDISVTASTDHATGSPAATYRIKQSTLTLKQGTLILIRNHPY